MEGRSYDCASIGGSLLIAVVAVSLLVHVIFDVVAAGKGAWVFGLVPLAILFIAYVNSQLRARGFLEAA